VDSGNVVRVAPAKNVGVIVQRRAHAGAESSADFAADAGTYACADGVTRTDSTDGKYLQRWPRLFQPRRPHAPLRRAPRR